MAASFNLNYNYVENFSLDVNHHPFDPHGIFDKIEKKGALDKEIDIFVRDKLIQLQETGNVMTEERKITLKLLHDILDLRDKTFNMQNVGLWSGLRKNPIQKEKDQYDKISGATFRETLHRLAHSPDTTTLKQALKGSNIFQTFFYSNARLIYNFVSDSFKEMGFTKWNPKAMPAWVTEEAMVDLEKLETQMRKLGIGDEDKTLKMIEELKSHLTSISSRAALPNVILEMIGDMDIESAFIHWKNDENFDQNMRRVLDRSTPEDFLAIYKKIIALIQSGGPLAIKGEQLISHFLKKINPDKQIFFSQQLNKELLVKLLSHLPKETICLNLKGCEKIVDDDIVQIIASSFSALKRLDLTRCDNITDVGAKAIATLTTLRQLSLSGACISDVGIQAMGTYLISLEQLDLIRCPYITDAGFQALGTLTSLKHLNLTFAFNLSSVGIQAIVTHLTSLQYLNLCSCYKISDSDVRKIASRLTSLQDLNLAECKKISNISIQMIGTYLIHLEQLVLSYCENLIDIDIKALAPLVALKQLNFSRCHLTDLNVQSITTYLPSLQRLNLVACRNLTDVAFALLKEKGFVATSEGSEPRIFIKPLAE